MKIDRQDEDLSALKQEIVQLQGQIESEKQVAKEHVKHKEVLETQHQQGILDQNRLHDHNDRICIIRY